MARFAKFSAVVLAGGLGLTSFGVSTSGASISSVGTAHSSSSSPRTSVAACVSKAKSVVTAASAPTSLASLAAQSHLDVAKLKGKTVWFVADSLADPIDTEIASAFQAAAKAAGVTVHLFNGNASTAAQDQGLSDAVAAHASGIIAHAITAADATVALGKAKAAKIPVVGSELTPNALFTGGVVNANFTQVGVDMGAYAAEKSGCKADVLLLYTNSFQNLINMGNGVSTELASLCPKTCKVTKENVEIANLATAVTPMVSSAILKDPHINYIAATYDALTTFIVPALRQAHSKAKIMGNGMSTANLALIKSNSYQSVDTGNATYMIGWGAFDQLARAMLHLPVSKYDEAIPTQLIDSSNYATAVTFPALAGYQSTFKKLWGLG